MDRRKCIVQGSGVEQELFVMAHSAAPTIMFMDKNDYIVSSMTDGGDGGDGGDSEVQSTMLELLDQLC